MGLVKATASPVFSARARTGPGVSGFSTSSVGVDAKTQSGPAALRAVHAGDGLAGLFGGHVRVTRRPRRRGDLRAPGGRTSPKSSGWSGRWLPSRAASSCWPAMTEFASATSLMTAASPGSCQVRATTARASSWTVNPDANRCPLALSGKVWCKVDADWAPIEVGDMLTTSPTPGHAMRATDPARAFGAVIGKALGSLSVGPRTGSRTRSFAVEHMQLGGFHDVAEP